MDTPTKLDVISKKLFEYFSGNQREDIISAYIFGSRVAGTFTKQSDIDIGILLRKEYRLSNDDLFTIISDIAKIVSPFEPDVKILNEISIRVLHNMLKNAQLIYCVDENADADFREDLYRKYFDLKPILLEFLNNL